MTNKELINIVKQYPFEKNGLKIMLYNSTDEECIVNIIGVNRDNIIVFDYEDENYIMAESMESLDDIKPITITEEWLIKFGFEKVGISRWGISKYPYYCYFDGVEWCHKIGLDSDLVFASTEYVHQLQNLYFILIGEELKL